MMSRSVLILSFFTLLSSASAKQQNAAQAILHEPIAAVQEAVSSLSSLFAGCEAPAPTRAPYCCAPDCPPEACDVNRVIPTDLGYLFPAPTAPAHKQPSTPVQIPCCGLGCIDGGCRDPTLRRKRPMITRPADLKPTSTLNVIRGCCSTCKDCDQVVVTTRDESLLSIAKATPIPEPEGLGAKRVICIGCHPCTPCDLAHITTFLSFNARPTLEGRAARATGGAENNVEAETRTASPATTTTTTTGSSDTAEPTYILGDDVNDSINGENQDTLPIVIQAGPKAGGELITLLATVDLKLSENYISRRYLAQLSLLGAVTPYPKGLNPATAILSNYLDQTPINATIVLNMTAGSHVSQPVTYALFKNVRFNVYGSVADDVIRIPDVILGSRMLTHVGALSVFDGFRSSVQKGIKVLFPAHAAQLVSDRERTIMEGGEQKGGHDEL